MQRVLGNEIKKDNFLLILIILSLVPYKYLPKLLQDLKNILETVNPFKRLHDKVTSMSEKSALEKLLPGDHIYCYRKEFYSHHGIYAGDGMVWEYDGLMGTGAKIKLSSLRKFSLGAAINRLNYDSDFSQEEILQRAASRKYENKYNILDNNCMHFAFWCRLQNSENLDVVEKVFKLLLYGKNYDNIKLF